MAAPVEQTLSELPVPRDTDRDILPITFQPPPPHERREVAILDEASDSIVANCVSEAQKSSLNFYPITLAFVAGFLMATGMTLMGLLFILAFLSAPRIIMAQESADRIRISQKILLSDTPKIRDFLTRINSGHCISRLDDSHEEPTPWLNDLIRKFWPYINLLIQKQIDLRGFSQKGSGIELLGSKLYFERFTLGDKPPIVSHVTILTDTRPDELVINAKILYYGNCLLSLSRRSLGLFKLKVGVKDIYFQGEMRIVLRPLIKDPPFIGGLTLTLLEPPLVNFEGYNLASLADNQIVKNMILTIISGILVQPNKIFIPFMRRKDLKRGVVFPKPKGLCVFQVIEAKNFTPSEHNLTGRTTHPFCVVRVGESYFQTPTIVHESRDPIWNFQQTSVYNDAIEDFAIEFYERQTQRNLLGNIRFPIHTILSDPAINGLDQWTPLGKVNMSNQDSVLIHFRVTCHELSSEPPDFKLTKEIPAHSPIGVLSVYIHNIRIFPLKKKPPSVFFNFRFARQTYTTSSVKTNTTLPKSMNEGFHFVLYQNDIEQEICHIIAAQKGKTKPAAVAAKNYAFGVDEVVGSRSLELEPLSRREGMSVERDIVLYKKEQPVVKMTLYMGISIVKYDERIYENQKKKLVSHETSHVSFTQKVRNLIKNPFKKKYSRQQDN